MPASPPKKPQASPEKAKPEAKTEETTPEKAPEPRGGIDDLRRIIAMIERAVQTNQVPTVYVGSSW